jgi:hypothetical protein
MAAKYGEDIVLYFTVVSACTVQRLHKYLFDLTTLGDLDPGYATSLSLSINCVVLSFSQFWFL